MGRIDSKNLAVSRQSPTTVKYSITDKPLPSSVHGVLLLLLLHVLRLAIGIWGLLIGAIVLHGRWQEWHSRKTDSPTTTGQSVTNPGIDSPARLLNGLVTKINPWQTVATILAFPLELSGVPNLHARAISTPEALPNESLLFYSAFISAVLLLLASRPKTTTDTLLVLHTLGLQTSQTVTAFPLLLLLSHTLKKYIGFDFGISALFGTTTTRFIPTSQIQDVLIHEAFRGWEVRFYLAIIVKGESEAVVVFERLLPRLEVVQKVWRGAREVLWEDGKSSQDRRDREACP